MLEMKKTAIGERTWKLLSRYYIFHWLNPNTERWKWGKVVKGKDWFTPLQSMA